MIRASLADRVQRMRQVTAKYQERTEYLRPTPAQEQTPFQRVEWGWISTGNEYCRQSGWKSPDEMEVKLNVAPGSWNWRASTGFSWAYDGTRRLAYPTDKDDQMLKVEVSKTPPDISHQQLIEAPSLLGLRVRNMENDLATLASHPDTKLIASLDVQGRPLPGFELTADGTGSSLITVIVALDPDKDWLPTLIRSDWHDKTGEVKTHSTLIVTSTMSVPDGDTAAEIIVPKSALRKISSTDYGDEFQIFIDVDEIRINAPVDSREFAPVIPDGVIVEELPSKPGALPRTYVSGGKEAERNFLTARTEEIARERERLVGVYPALDATPIQSSPLRRWLAAIGLGMLLAALVAGLRRWSPEHFSFRRRS